MKLVITGATGNVGTSLLAALRDDTTFDEIVGIARRPAGIEQPRVRFVTADISRDPLDEHLAGADAVVHLAWLIQPSRDEQTLHATNVEGSRRVFEAAARAGVRALVHASSIGTYAPGPKDRGVDESWPATGIPSLHYSRHKAECERMLDTLEREHPEMRVVRLRPGLIFKREAATEIRRLFAGPFVPSPLVRKELIPVVPDVPRLRVQAVHSLDIGEAYRLAATREVRGAFNIAADPVIDPELLSEVLGARRIPVQGRVLRTAADVSWRLHLQPAPAGWIDLALGVPLMDTTRARTELGWQPTRTATEALLELLDGIREGADYPTPPLAGGSGGPLRLREVLTGLGVRGGTRP
jgi:nucleoside-diphosphate-sugar epimerase